MHRGRHPAQGPARGPSQRPANALLFHLATVLFATATASASCRPKAPDSPPPPPTPAKPEGPAAQLVQATVLANGCQELGPANARLAERAMAQLVENCTSVPGGSIQFAATLLPVGRIEISAAPGQPEVVPICVLKHSLLHSVRLAKPCRLDVKIEQTRVQVAPRSSQP
jgi:hypothetical protein